MNKEDLRRIEAIEARVERLEKAMIPEGDTAANPFTPVPHVETNNPVSGAPVTFPPVRKPE